MEAILLGTGTSQGVPLIACGCAVCRSADPRNRRTRTSVHVVLGGRHVQVDAAPEFRLQCLANGIGRIDHFILTHGHSDHVVGMDDLRRFCDLLGGAALPVYSTPEGLARVRAIYPYAIVERPISRGYPAFSLREMPAVLEFPGATIRSTPLPHGGVNTLGLIFSEKGNDRRLAYYTDCKRVPTEAIELARGVDTLILDGLRPEPHATHLSIPEAIDVAREIGARQTWLLHLTHLTDHAPAEAALPTGIRLAYDGLRVTL